MMRLRQETIPESEIHFILSNPRRREVLSFLDRNAGASTVSELSEFIASSETGEDPAPRQVRETVYISLHQTHLPALDELGIIEYDLTNKEITSLEATRDLRVYMEVVTRFGITWDEYYRYLGVLGLLVIVAVEMGVPWIGSVGSLVWATLFLGIFAISTMYQFRGLGSSVKYWLSNVGRNRR